jgi:DHA2 family multidrug resistance protein
MTAFSPQMDWRPLVVSGVVQGLGLGLVFVPLSTLAFATLDPRFRAEAASLFSLVRNIGSSVGISIVATELSHTMVAARSDIVSQLTAANPNLDGYFAAAGGETATSLAQLGNLVQAQAAMIAYIDDFMLMFWLTLASIPLILLLRRPGAPAGDGGAHAAAAME